MRRRIADPAAISPEDLAAAVTEVQREITRKRHLNSPRLHRSYPRKVKQVRRSRFPAKRPDDRGVRHAGPPTVRLVNLPEQATRTA